MQKLGFIGAGKMATAIAKGLADRQAWPRPAMLAADVAPAARAAFTAATGVPCAESATEVAAAADLVLLAIKPQKAPELAPLLAPHCRGKLVISIAAGLTVKRLAGWFGHDRIIRVMPNTPLMVGKGATVFTCGAGAANAPDRATAKAIFGALGVVFELEESHLDAVTALSGSGPAYVFEMVAAMVEAGVAVGLPREVAHALTVQTVAGAALMLEQGLGTPDELRDAVTSPGGTTAAGLAVLAKGEFRKLKHDVIRAAHARSIELGRAAG